MPAAWCNDLKFALRSLRARPWTALVAVATLACGLGAAAAIASVVDAVLLRDLPYPRSERLVDVRELAADGHPMPVARPNFEDFVPALAGYGEFARYGGGSTTIARGGIVTRGGVVNAGGDFFAVLGVAPQLGRNFAGAERDQVAVIGHALWQNLFAGRADAIGQAIDLGGRRFTVIGVMPAGFAFPAGAQAWTPATLLPPETSRSAHNWAVVGRLRPAAALSGARIAAMTLGARLKQQYGDAIDAVGFALTPLAAAIAAPVRTALLVLAAGTIFLLLIAASNTINLLLALTATRGRELAIRAALGAAALRLVRQAVFESTLIAVTATALGLAGARLALGALVRLAGTALPRAGEIRLDGRALLVTALIALLLAAIVGAVVAWNSLSRSTAGELREGGRGQGASRASLRVRAGLLIAQTALTTLLLVGAGLLGRSFLALLEVDPGFRPEGAAAVQLTLPPPGDDTAAGQRLVARYRGLIGEFAALPGVSAVGGINALPLTDMGADGAFWAGNVTDFLHAPKPLGYAEYRVASGGYFAAAGIPLLAGRTFDDGDRPDGAHVAVVSRALAARTWPGVDPLGQRIQYGNMDGDTRVLTIVGIVGDVHEERLDRAPMGTVYVDLDQRPHVAADFNVIVRSGLPMAQLLTELRGTLTRSAADMPHALEPLAAIYSASLAQRRFSLILFGVFAAVALTLAIGGLYGLMAFTVGERRHEFALRQALGSTPARILGLVLGGGLRIGAAGLAAGIVAAMIAAHAAQSLLYGVPAADPLTLIAVAVVLLATLALACIVPARRACAVAPRETLG